MGKSVLFFGWCYLTFLLHVSAVLPFTLRQIFSPSKGKRAGLSHLSGPGPPWQDENDWASPAPGGQRSLLPTGPSCSLHLRHVRGKCNQCTWCPALRIPSRRPFLFPQPTEMLLLPPQPQSRAVTQKLAPVKTGVNKGSFAALL